MKSLNYGNPSIYFYLKEPDVSGMQIINLNALSEMFFGDNDKVRIVVGALVDRIPEWQEQVQVCLKAGDHDETRELCHRIRGAAASIKAEKLTEAVTHLGNVIKTKQFDKIPEGFNDLGHALEEIRHHALDLNI